jgi:hypothetical protein
MKIKFNIYKESNYACPDCAEILREEAEEVETNVEPPEQKIDPAKASRDELINKISKEAVALNSKLDLLSVMGDEKTKKSIHDTRSGDMYITGILYLSPAEEGGGVNVCRGSTGSCRIGCLNRSGNPAFMKGKLAARYRKTQEMHLSPDDFFLKIQSDILRLKMFAKKYNIKLAIRLNGTSDVDFESKLDAFIRQHNDVKFYDYTKVIPKYKKWKSGNGLIHQTFSRSELTDKQAEEILKDGGNVAYVFYQKSKMLPAYYKGYKVINGDESDLRFLDDLHRELDEAGKPKGIIIGLTAKGDVKGRGARARAIRRSKMWNKKQANPNYIDSPEFKKDAADYFGVEALDELLNDTDKLKEYQNFRNPDGRLLEPDGNFEIIVDDMLKKDPSAFDAPKGVKPDGTPVIDKSLEAEAGAKDSLGESLKYINRFDDVIRMVKEGAYVHTKASVDAYKDQEGASKKIQENIGTLKQNPDDYETLKDTFNIINTFEGNDFLLKNKTVSKADILKYLLELTKTDTHDYTKLKTHTIDEYKGEGGLESFYHLYKEIIKTIGDLAKARSRREAGKTYKPGQEPIFYFGPDGEPYRTSVFVPESGIIEKSFWNGNRMAGKLLPPPAPFNKYTPKELQGKTIDEIRDAVDHEAAKDAFEKKYPPNDPNLVSFYKKLR